MPSESNANKDLRHRQRQIINKAIEELGFKNEAELAQKCGLNQGALNKILKGQTCLTDKSADTLCLAIFERNQDIGWSYSECASYLADTINYIWNHLAKLKNKEPRKNIEDNDIIRWVNLHRERLRKRIKTQSRAVVYNNPDFIIEPPVLNESYECLMTFIKRWDMKYDFGLFYITQSVFKNNLLVIDDFLQQGIEQDLYEPVKEVFENTRYIAHLCGAKYLVIKVSEWLMIHSQNHSDMRTYLMAKSILAWSYTSHREESYLNQARYLTDQAWNLLNNSNNLSKIDADVVAILCELKLRIPVRLCLHQNHHIAVNKFEIIKNQSDAMMGRLVECQVLEPRLRARFQIALKYQHGIYYFLIKEYEKAIEEFKHIAKKANYIGWTRVEEGAYSWLGTLTEKIGDIRACRKYWNKIDENANYKRLALRNSTYERLDTNFQ